MLCSVPLPEVNFIEPLDDSSLLLRADSIAVLGWSVGVVASAQVDGYGALYGDLETAAVTARNRIAETFRNVAGSLPRSTEVERLVVQRVRQPLFRGALLDYWQRRCPVTGLAISGLLRASHIKP